LFVRGQKPSFLFVIVLLLLFYLLLFVYRARQYPAKEKRFLKKPALLFCICKRNVVAKSHNKKAKKKENGRG